MFFYLIDDMYVDQVLLICSWVYRLYMGDLLVCKVLCN